MISVPRRVGGGSGRARRADEALPARGVARGRREPDRAPGADDARLDRRRAVRGAAEPRPPLGRNRGGRRSDRRPRRCARPGRRARQVTVCYLATARAADRPVSHGRGPNGRGVPAGHVRRAVALRLRADVLHPRAEGRAGGARARARRRQAPAALPHPSRPRGRGGRARPRASGADRVGVGDRRAASHRPVPARAERPAALRRCVRRALGRARAGARGERAHREQPRRRARDLSRARSCLAPRLLLRRHDGLRGRCGRGADPAEPRRCYRRRRRPTSTSRAGTERSRRSSAARPNGWR